MKNILAITIDRYVKHLVESQIPRTTAVMQAMWREAHRDFLENQPFPLWRLLGVRSGKPSKTALKQELDRAHFAYEGADKGEYLERRASEKIRRAYRMLEGKSKRQWRKWWKIRKEYA